MVESRGVVFAKTIRECSTVLRVDFLAAHVSLLKADFTKEWDVNWKVAKSALCGPPNSQITGYLDFSDFPLKDAEDKCLVLLSGDDNVQLPFYRSLVEDGQYQGLIKHLFLVACAVIIERAGKAEPGQEPKQNNGNAFDEAKKKIDFTLADDRPIAVKEFVEQVQCFQKVDSDSNPLPNSSSFSSPLPTQVTSSQAFISTSVREHASQIDKVAVVSPGSARSESSEKFVEDVKVGASFWNFAAEEFNMWWRFLVSKYPERAQAGVEKVGFVVKEAKVPGKQEIEAQAKEQGASEAACGDPSKVRGGFQAPRELPVFPLEFVQDGCDPLIADGLPVNCLELVVQQQEQQKKQQ